MFAYVHAVRQKQ